MISKEEYIRLYCDEVAYQKYGVVAISADKFTERLIADPLKTIQDIDDYGFSDAMGQSGITNVKGMNPHTGQVADAPVHSHPTIRFDMKVLNCGYEDEIE